MTGQSQPRKAPRDICPVCGRFDERATVHIEPEPAGIHTVTYMCPRRHQWLTKWLEDKEAPAA